MRAALDSLAAMRADRRVAVLGLMAEIDDPEPAHREIAASARSLGLELIAVGTDLYGIEPLDGPRPPSPPSARSARRDVVLVKASRSAGLERVVAALLSPGAASGVGERLAAVLDCQERRLREAAQVHEPREEERERRAEAEHRPGADPFDDHTERAGCRSAPCRRTP